MCVLYKALLLHIAAAATGPNVIFKLQIWLVEKTAAGVGTAAGHESAAASASSIF